MSEDAERNQPASDKRRQEFRERGQVAKSRDLSTGAVLVVGGVTIMATARQAAEAVTVLTRASFGAIGKAGTHVELGTVVWTVMQAAGFVGLACALTALATGFAQVGFLPSKAWAKFDFEKLNPLPRFGQMFGSKDAVLGIFATLLKVGLVVGVCGVSIASAIRILANAAPASIGEALQLAKTILVDILRRGTPVVLAIGAADYAWNRFKLEQSMKMSNEEMREENKEDNGDPHVKGQRKRRARELLKSRSIAKVKTADVVVVNPTHYAVALQYKKGMRAPKVVAKGVDEVAARIREMAKRHNVPIVREPPLARALHSTVKVGHDVPAELYKAVAVVLAFVYRQKRRVA